METTELLDDLHASEGMIVTPQIKGYLSTTASWGLFLAILGLITAALMILGGIAFAFMMVAVDPISQDIPSAFPVAAIALIYPLLGLAYLYPSIKLLGFCNNVKAAISSESTEELTKAFRNLKSMFKFMGIFTIVGFGLYILLIVGMVVFGVSGLI